MKTIVCGPPHSGKSVFIVNLEKLMPYGASYTIRANGDGEGSWSNNPNQEDTKKTRRKGTNSPEDFTFWENLIHTATQEIVLVDIGGKLQDDKGLLFDACDSFIIISREDENLMKEWKEFGEKHGCECIAAISSNLDGREELYDTTPYIRACISGLERGKELPNSIVIKQVAETLIHKSKYKAYSYINMGEVMKKIGVSKPWRTSKGIEVERMWMPKEKAVELYDYLCENYNTSRRYKVVDVTSNWISCVITNCLCLDSIEDICFYNPWSNRFVTPKILNKTATVEEVDYSVDVAETEDAVRLDFTLLSNNGLDEERLASYQIPIINESKPLYISGRFPNWFYVSIVRTYLNPEKYLHVPGKYFICAQSDDKHNLGKTISIEDADNITAKIDNLDFREAD